MMKLIFVSHPCTARTKRERNENVKRARAIKERLQRADKANWYYCPVGDLPADWDWETSMRLCKGILRKCDEAIFCDGGKTLDGVSDWHNSDGCREEYILAAELGIPVRGLARDGTFYSQEVCDRLL